MFSEIIRAPRPLSLAEFRGRVGRWRNGRDWNRVLRKDVCAYCCSRDELTVEHIMPLSLGGTNAETNRGTACNFCNHTRASYPLLAFLAWRHSGVSGHVTFDQWRGVKMPRRLRTREYVPERVASPLYTSLAERAGAVPLPEGWVLPT